MKITITLYFKLISLFCILTFCKNQHLQATEISPIIGLGQENFTFEVTEFDPNNKKRTLKFEPNIAGILKLGISAYGFGIGYSFRGAEKDTDINKGKTNFSDWQLGYNSKNWGVETFYQNYKGFYTESTNAIQTFSDLKFNHIGLTARYAIGDEEFSVGGLTDQSNEIKETSGKYYLLFGYDEHNMETNISLLQLENAGINSDFENLRALKSNDIKVGIGAGKYWVHQGQLYIGGMMDLLATYANYDYTTTTQSYSDHDLTTSVNIRLGLGYKDSNIRYGVSFAGDATTLLAPGKAIIRPSANKALLYVRFITEI